MDRSQTVPVDKVLEALGVSYANYANWDRRGYLSTELEPAKRGTARQLTYENALEIGFIGSLVEGRMTPLVAAVFARAWIKRKGPPCRWFAINPRSPDLGLSIDGTPDLAQLAADLADEPEAGYQMQDGEDDLAIMSNNDEPPARQIILVDVQEVARRVDACFGAGEVRHA